MHEYRRAKERGDLWKKASDIPYNTTFEGWIKLPYKNGFEGSVRGIFEHQQSKGGYCRIFNGGESCQRATAEERRDRFIRAMRTLDQHCLVMVLELMPLLPDAVYATLGWKVEFPRAQSSDRELGDLYAQINAEKFSAHKYMVNEGVLTAHYFDTIIYYWAKRRMLEKLKGCDSAATCPQDAP